jgi:hypothetical protein
MEYGDAGMMAPCQAESLCEASIRYSPRPLRAAELEAWPRMLVCVILDER